MPHIFAIGDVVGQPMLAHKAVHEGKVAAEAASGMKSFFDAAVIPSVAYTDPEVAWVGLTENEAKAKGIKYGKGRLPVGGLGPLAGAGPRRGLDQAPVRRGDPPPARAAASSARVRASSSPRPALAIEMGADATDIGLTIHAHPTLSESIGMAAEMYEGTITDLIAPKKKH